jgi:GTPase Era involved in 16S rRNA processing
MNCFETKEALREIGSCVASILSRLNDHGLLSDFADWHTDLESNVFTVVVVGEFNRGKSTLLNALFGRDILPVGATPTTAFVTILRYSEVQQIQVHHVGGRIEEVAFSEDAVKAIVSSVTSPSTEIDFVEVGIPHTLLKAGIVYVDTPGVADLNRDRVEVTYRFVPRADAVIFVLDSTEAVTGSEIDFLESTILTRGIDRLLFVLNFADQLKTEDRRTAAERAQNRLALALDRDDLPVLVLSAREASSETERSRSGIDKLEDQLRAINLDGMRSQEKIAHLSQRLLAIVLALKADAERKRTSSRLEAEEFNRQIAEVDEQWRYREERIGRIAAWTSDREAEILAMARKSMETYFRALREDVGDQIAAYSGADFKGFVETQIPLMIKKRCTMWVDGHGDALRYLLIRLSTELTAALAKEFQTTIPMLEPRFVSRGIAVENVQIDSPDAPNGRLYAGLILGGVSALLMLTGVGLLMPMLSFAGFPWLAGRLDKSGLEEAKQKLMPQFDVALYLAAESMRDRVLGYLVDEVRGLQESAELRYQQLLEAARSGIREEVASRDQPTAIIRSRISVLDETLANLEKLECQISSLLSNGSREASA